ncbi:hypothetical protein M0802_002647 [Mischocyttarus mexicanus]|nr:hypothetical protein M0802_002647 [Mischocyttarus mexicanus]
MATLLRKSYVDFVKVFDKIRGGFGGYEHVTLRRSIGTRAKRENTRRIVSISLGVLAGAATTCGSVLYFLDSTVKADLTQALPPSYPWKFDGIFTSFDHTALRRGWQVYKAICSTCHSLEYVRFMDLINVTHTKEEVAAIAADYEIEDGPDEEGNYYKRPGRLVDRIPLPFPNEEAARFANNGSYPPDLTCIVLARRNGRNYIFSLLTGYMDPPAGVILSDTQRFNPYFLGSGISMPNLLQDGIIDYDDGTPATKAQMSKDVVEFLSWTSSQEHDTRKLMTIKVIGIGTILMIALLHMKRSIWTVVMDKRIFYISRDKCK